jgi:phospholipid/cholesterol/gamma-HCH transport system ATP-binding protein
MQPGETLVLMGKNGSGKTMLLKTLVGLFQTRSAVHAEILGKNVHTLKHRDLDRTAGRKIGYVFQKSGLFDSLHVWENVVFALRRYKDLGADELRQKGDGVPQPRGTQGRGR